MEKYEKKIAGLEKKGADIAGQMEKLDGFVASKGLGDEFAEYVKALAPKTMRQRLEEAKASADGYNRQRKIQQGLSKKDRWWQQEM